LIGTYILWNHVQYAGPNSNEIRKYTYKIDDNKYLKFDVEMCVCSPSAKNLFKEKMKK